MAFRKALGHIIINNTSVVKNPVNNNKKKTPVSIDSGCLGKKLKSEGTFKGLDETDLSSS